MSEPKTVSPDSAGAKAQKQATSNSTDGDDSGVRDMLPDISRWHIILLVALGIVAYLVYREASKDDDTEYTPQTKEVEKVKEDVETIEEANSNDSDDEEEGEIELPDTNDELAKDDALAEEVF